MLTTITAASTVNFADNTAVVFVVPVTALAALPADIVKTLPTRNF